MDKAEFILKRKEHLDLLKVESFDVSVGVNKTKTGDLYTSEIRVNSKGGSRFNYFLGEVMKENAKLILTKVKELSKTTLLKEKEHAIADLEAYIIHLKSDG